MLHYYERQFRWTDESTENHSIQLQHTEQSHFINYVFFRIDRVLLCWKWFSFGVLSRADLCSPLIYCRAQHSKPQSNQTFDLISPGFRSTNFTQNNRSFKLCPKVWQLTSTWLNLEQLINCTSQLKRFIIILSILPINVNINVYVNIELKIFYWKF